MSLYSIIMLFDLILFIIVAGTIIYLFIFAFAALVVKSDKCQPARKHNRILVLIPAYKEDGVIESTVRSF